MSPLHQKALLVMLCWFHLGRYRVNVDVLLGKCPIVEQSFPIDFDFLSPFAWIAVGLLLNEISSRLPIVGVLLAGYLSDGYLTAIMEWEWVHMQAWVCHLSTTIPYYNSTPVALLNVKVSQSISEYQYRERLNMKRRRRRRNQIVKGRSCDRMPLPM